MARQDHFSGRDLLAAVRRGEGTLRGQLEAQLREDVRAGRLRPGEALPSTRALAAELSVSRGVVVEAYAQLTAEGFLVARRGAATRVAERAATAPDAPAASPPLVAPPPVGPSATRWNFSADSADLAAFPRRAWATSVRRALEAAPDSALGYGDRAGAPALRSALSGYLGRSRGVAAGPGQVVVATGMTQALALAVRALELRRVGVEDPGFPVHRELLRRLGVAVVPLPVDEGGLLVDALDGLDAVLVTPAHQMPTGAVLAPERRSALAAWGGWVLEDDYDGELRYDREPLGALQGLSPGRTVYLGTASKTLAPGLRLGWLVAPPDLAARAAELKGWDDGGSDVVGQLALADLIARGELDRHLRRMRARYRRRRDALVGGISRWLPDARVAGAAAGLHVLARLPDGEAVRPLLAAARRRGVGVLGFEHGGGSALLLGYGNLPEPAIEPGLRAIAEARESLA